MHGSAWGPPSPGSCVCDRASFKWQCAAVTYWHSASFLLPVGATRPSPPGSSLAGFRARVPRASVGHSGTHVLPTDGRRSIAERTAPEWSHEAHLSNVPRRMHTHYIVAPARGVNVTSV